MRTEYFMARVRHMDQFGIYVSLSQFSDKEILLFVDNKGIVVSLKEKERASDLFQPMPLKLCIHPCAGMDPAAGGTVHLCKRISLPDFLIIVKTRSGYGSTVLEVFPSAVWMLSGRVFFSFAGGTTDSAKQAHRKPGDSSGLKTDHRSI